MDAACCRNSGEGPQIGGDHVVAGPGVAAAWATADAGGMPTDDEVVAAAAGADPAALGRDYGATLWEPGPEVIERARITQFCRWLARERGLPLGDPAAAPGRAYHDLWQWSVAEPAEFWESRVGLLRGARAARRRAGAGRRPHAGRQWFPGATLNYARNALRTAVSRPRPTAAIIACAEDGAPRTLTYGELAAEVARVRAALRGLGRGQGRPGGRLPAQRAGGADRPARHGEPRRHLVVLLPGLRAAERDRPVRADHPQGAAGHRAATATAARSSTGGRRSPTSSPRCPAWPP